MRLAGEIGDGVRRGGCAEDGAHVDAGTGGRGNADSSPDARSWPARREGRTPSAASFRARSSSSNESRCRVNFVERSKRKGELRFSASSTCCQLKICRRRNRPPRLQARSSASRKSRLLACERKRNAAVVEDGAAVAQFEMADAQAEQSVAPGPSWCWRGAWGKAHCCGRLDRLARTLRGRSSNQLDRARLAGETKK